MRPIIYSVIAISAVLFSSCFSDQCTEVYPVSYQVPVYKMKSELETEITSSKEIVAPGAIYLYNGYLYVNESEQGIHVIRNTDPQSPQNEKFIGIEGNHSMATYGKYLYADQYTDLVVVDLASAQDPIIIGRVENVFNEHLIIGDSIIAGYTLYEGNYEVPCNSEIFMWDFINGGGGGPEVIFNSTSGVDGSVSTDIRNGGVQTGIAGSLARFIVTRGHLYVVDDQSLKVFSLEDPVNPVKVFSTYVGGVETIFPLGHHLFLGTRFGMEIYDIELPGTPQHVSSYNHWKSCDPVFVYGDKVFVTLSSGNLCQNGVNELQVLDISDLFNPRLLHTFPMDNPKGLSVFNDKLWLCESEFGLKVFSLTDLAKIDENLLDQEDYNSIDIITLNDEHSILMAADGIYQLRWDGDESQGNIVELSKL